MDSEYVSDDEHNEANANASANENEVEGEEQAMEELRRVVREMSQMSLQGERMVATIETRPNSANGDTETEYEDDDDTEEEKEGVFAKVRRWFSKKKKPKKGSLLPIVTLRRQSSEYDDGVLFGVRRKHMRAQVNLSILTFMTTATFSCLLLTFCAAMIAWRGAAGEDWAINLLLFIIGAWLPSPTTLLRPRAR